jgi:hypothetical protein
MKNKTILLGVIAVTLLAMVGAVMAVGNGWAGYHNNNIFVGTCQQWCTQKPTDCGYCGAYINDKITMKWNQAWDTCNAGASCVGAWTDNEWNGMFPGGSGTTEHYKIVWIGDNCEADGAPLPDGGYCVWGSYEVVMDQGTASGVHSWYAHALPTGYGS